MDGVAASGFVAETRPSYLKPIIYSCAPRCCIASADHIHIATDGREPLGGMGALLSWVFAWQLNLEHCRGS